MEKLTDAIKSVDLLHAQPGDVLVLLYSGHLHAQEAERITGTLKNLVPESVEVLILENGMGIKLLRPELISPEDLDALKKYELGAPDGKTD